MNPRPLPNLSQGSFFNSILESIINFFGNKLLFQFVSKF